MVKRLLIACSITLAALSSCGGGSGDRTYCNPLDLDSGWGVFKPELPLCRTSADPVIVTFKDKYYLFSTHDIGGYRVSDNLLDWKDLSFNEEVREAALNGDTYVAPAAAADEHYVYFIKLNRDRSSSTVKIIRTSDPEHGKWEICGEIPRVADPSLFIDGGRYFIFHGLGGGIRRFELDPQTMTMMEGTEEIVVDNPKSLDECDGGCNFGRREIYDEIEAPEWKGRFSRLPCQEGSWVVRNGDRYYLQVATPGTICIWYCDALYTSSRPDGCFAEETYGPVSLKAGGFIGGAGHSSVFRDRYGNWWEVTTMWIGNSNEFERRLGLFPVSFDDKGRMRVHTTLGDYPMTVPQRRFDPEKESTLRGWWCLSFGKKCEASSAKEGFPPSKASDENVRTWWAAADDDAAPWLQMDLGTEAEVNALQLNFSEQDYTPDSREDDYTSYIVYSSCDGRKWRKIADRSGNSRTNPHEYIELDRAVKGRYIKVECVHPMNGMSFAVRDLRVFGNALGDVPPPVEEVLVERDAEDARFARVSWKPVQGADGYLVRFGPEEGFLNQVIQVKGGDESSLTVHILNRKSPYIFKIQAYNGNGLSE